MLNYNRIYEYRFANVDRNKKQITWKLISNFISKLLNNPAKILDPAAGFCEFINNVPAQEKWAIDLNEDLPKYAEKGVKTIKGNSLEVDLPENYFDAAFVSNFLEHLNTHEEVAFFLEKILKTLKSGGYIAVMGPNFKYVYKEYFDFADHKVILTDLSLSEHLYGAGFEIVKSYPQFIPLSFRGKLPVNGFLVNTYLAMPFFWRFFGKQFLVIARKQ